MKSNSSVVLFAIACFLPSAATLAQQKVPGESWRHTVSIEAAGFSMPARTTEMCAPIGKAEEAMSRQQGPSECAVSNMKQSGNKVSYDFRCTGKSAMDGHFESERTGDTMRGTMTGNAEGQSMTMKFEATKLPKACEALDYSNYKPPVVAAVPLMDTCQAIGDKMDPKDLTSVGSALLGQYPTPDGKGITGCKQHAAFKKYCSAVQTPAGYASLENQEWNMRAVKASPGETEQSRMMRAPLTESIHACGLGTDAAAGPALQKRMVESAKKDGRWGFLLYYAAAQEYPAMKETAKKECSGRSFTSAANPQYAGLCANYGAAFARDDRSGVLQAAGCGEEREDVAHGICVGAKSTGSGSMAKDGSAPAGAAGASGTASVVPTEASAEEAAKKAAAEKGNSTLDKGKKALKGLFGH